jgi:acyl-CoA thioesterase-1
MMGCDMGDGLLKSTRRLWLAHCSALALAAVAPGLRAQAKPFRILVVGDSLSAEYGLPRDSGWVALMVQRLRQEKVSALVTNASISGDTTAGGRARLQPLLDKYRPTHVVLELGANDALRGLPLDATQANLVQMVGTCKAAGARVLLVGMRMPPNYGRRYGDDFVAMYQRVGREQQVPLVPFLLKGVADVPDADRWFQSDHLHPVAQAHPVILNNVWPLLKPMLRS